MKISVETRGEGVEYAKEIAKQLPKALREKTKHWADIIRDQARLKTPRDRGQLRRSIKSKVFGYRVDTVFGVVGTNKWYSRFVEKGVKAHFVPFAEAPNLVRWLRKKGTTVVQNSSGRYDVWLKGSNTILLGNVKGMRMSGKARPFLQPAFDANVDKAVQDFNSLLGDVKKKVGS